MKIMTIKQIAMANTVLEALQISLTRAGRFDSGDMVAPAAILWPDTDGEWQPVVNKLKATMSHILTLGEYKPEIKQGPAIWLKCIIDRSIIDGTIGDKYIPIIYMPHVSRQTLRNIEECPDTLKPLVELQFRGTVWMQKNGKDWTIEAFLVSDEGGLGLDVAQDKQTHISLLGALPQLAVTPLARLREKRIDAEDLDKLMVEDTPRDLLQWMSDPREMKELWHAIRWKAFCSRCSAEYGFNPEKDGVLIAGEKLGRRNDAWKTVWQRYAESPDLYSGIPDLLQRAKPAELLFVKETWPDENSEEEKSLRNDLVKLRSMDPSAAREEIEKLETRHGERRDWVWSRLGYSSLAEALKHLVAVAKDTAHVPAIGSIEEAASLYTGELHFVDKSALKAISSVKSTEDKSAVAAVLSSFYTPWLDDCARAFQNVINKSADLTLVSSNVQAEPGTCIVFIDALRYDLAAMLISELEDKSINTKKGWRLSALPSVTATAKPAVSPIADKISGTGSLGTFAPSVKGKNVELTTDRFQKLLEESDIQYFTMAGIEPPASLEKTGWVEVGEFDRLGHSLQSRLAFHLDEQIEILVERIRSLFELGWKKIRLVTDHGWLLVAGGLPSLSIPKYLTESRWARCAWLKDSAHSEMPTARWHWNQQEHFAYAPGIHCFKAGIEYAHGGISLQECILPDFDLVSTAVQPVSARILDVQWLSMRCRVYAEKSSSPIKAVLRTKTGDPTSNICEPKDLDNEGKVGLLVEDDGFEGASATVVLLDRQGNVLFKYPTVVGG
jgi:hypothetical protein